MRIAMIGQKGIPAHSGGVEQVIDMLSRHLTARGHELFVYCRRSYHGRQAQTTHEGLLHRIFRPSIPTKHLDAITHTLTSTVDVALRRADVVHYHAIGPAALAPLARLAGLPVVVTVHGLDWQRAKWGRFAKSCLQLGQWIAGCAANQFTVVSPVLQEYFQQRKNLATHFIPNGVVPIPFRPERRLTEFGIRPRRYLLAASRLVPEKGLHYLIEAMEKLDRDVQLVIAGGGGLDNSYERQLSACQNPNVIFTGPADREFLAELYSHALMFCLPSDLEGMSIALLEAMSMKLPVLVSDIPENLCVVGNNGLVFQAGNVSSLRNELQRALDQPELLTRCAQEMGRLARQFEWSSVVDQLEQVYQSCAAGSNLILSPGNA